jgi:hypothetical protein
MMRGKEKPNDIDILLIFKKKIDKDIEYEFRKKTDAQVISKTEKDLIDPSFDPREGYLFEGYSLVYSKPIISRYGFTSVGLFIYETKPLSNSTKTRFYYALNGRNKDGIIDENKAKKLSDNIIMVPLDRIEPMKEFFDYWKLEYKYIPTLIPERLAKRQIIKHVRL